MCAGGAFGLDAHVRLDAAVGSSFAEVFRVTQNGERSEWIWRRWGR